jgi:hypothetical protein
MAKIKPPKKQRQKAPDCLGRRESRGLRDEMREISDKLDHIEIIDAIGANLQGVELDQFPSKNRFPPRLSFCD